jgi:cell wall-associated NlpC family hydrolase
MITEADIINRYLPVPYKHQGRDLLGLDCYGLLKDGFLFFLNIKLFDIEEDYTPDWSFKGKNYFLENCHKDFKEVVNSAVTNFNSETQLIGKPKLFDVVTFESKKGVMNHAGWMLDENRFINSCKLGTVVCRLSEGIWVSRFSGIYRHKGLIE